MRFQILVIFFTTITQNVFTRDFIFNKSHSPRSNKTAKLFNISDVDLMVEYDELVTKYEPNNFGDGFPNYLPPKHLLEAFQNVTHIEKSEVHQYTRVKGEPRLVRALAHLYSILIEREIDPFNEILVTAGAMQSLSFIAKAFLNPGDEVILFEPFYHSYEIIIKLAGGVPVYVPLRAINGKTAVISSELTFDVKELESKFNAKTKLIWLNNPNNPSGKTFTRNELENIANLAKKYDVIVVADEVAQFYYFEGPNHIRFASLSGMWERTLTVNSGGKTFSSTGWRIGWTIGPADLMWAIEVSLFNNIIAVPTATQLAFAIGMEIENERWGKSDSYYLWVRNEAKRMRDRFLKIFKENGIETVVPNAGYFINADFSKVIDQFDMSAEKDNRIGLKLSLWLLKEKNLFLMPGSLFYSENNKHLAENITRICFIKEDNLIDKFENIISGFIKLPFVKTHETSDL